MSSRSNMSSNKKKRKISSTSGTAASNALPRLPQQVWPIVVSFTLANTKPTKNKDPSGRRPVVKEKNAERRFEVHSDLAAAVELRNYTLVNKVSRLLMYLYIFGLRLHSLSLCMFIVVFFLQAISNGHQYR